MNFLVVFAFCKGMDIPTFHWRNRESGQNFMDNFELSCLLLGKDDPSFLPRLFPLSLKGEAREWYNRMTMPIKKDWNSLKEAFLNRFSPKPTCEDLWKRLQQLQQGDLRGYDSYERSFLGLLIQLQTMWEREGRMPDMIIRETFVNGLFKTLQDKVRCKFPNTFDEALQIARAKNRKLMYPLVKLGVVSEVLSSQTPYEFYYSHMSLPRCVTTKTEPCHVDRPQHQVEDLSKTFSNQSLIKVPLPPSIKDVECVKEVIIEELNVSLD